SMKRNKSYPALFQFFTSLYHFKLKEYAMAYSSFDESTLPEFGMSIILRVASLSLMGRKTEADLLAKTLKSHSLNKAWISKEFLNRFLLDEDLVDQIHKGFKSSKISLLTVA